MATKADKINAEVVKRWRENPARFIEEALGDPLAGKPYRLLPAERRFLEHCFKLGPDGRLLYPEQVYSCPKKSGKTAFAAMHLLTTLILFGGAYPEAAVVANDLEQAQARVFDACRKIVECSAWLRRLAKIYTDTIVFHSMGCSIRAIASEYAGAAGGNFVLANFDELWAYTSERSRRLWDEMIPPPTRKVALRLTTTYAGFDQESELLQELYERGLRQPVIGPDLYGGDGLLMFWTHDLVTPWQTDAWRDQMKKSLRPNQYARMNENRWVSTESSFIEMSWFDECVDPARRMQVAAPELPIYVGIDASVKHDSTAIVAVAYDRDANRVRLVWHRVFQPSPDAPLDFERTIERTVLELKQRFRLRKVLFDPWQMQATAQRLRARSIPIEEFPQSPGNLTEASQNLYELVKGRALSLYPDDGIRKAFSQSVAIEGSRGWRIAKEKQSHRIDVVVALGMAALAAVRQGVRPGQPASMETWDDVFGSSRSRGQAAASLEAERNVAAGSMPCLIDFAQLERERTKNLVDGVTQRIGTSTTLW